MKASLHTSTFTQPTTPIKLAVTSVVGTATANGTEATGGSYARQTLTVTTPTAGSATSAASITINNMPSMTCRGVEVWDSATTPIRLWQGPLTSNVTTASGDILTFASGAIVLTLS